MKKEITIEQQRQIQLDLLIYVDSFCRDNHIDYSLAFGTLLGAVRHKGYIPWDDDIDIMMTRKNYERFRNLYSSERFPFADLKNSKSHPVSMGKIYDSQTYFYYQGNIKRDYGLFIDVFPLDVVPEQEGIRMKWLKKVKWYSKLNQFKNNSFTFSLKQPKITHRVLGCFVKMFFSSSNIHNKLDSLYFKYDKDSSKILGVPAVMVMSKKNLSKMFPQRLFDNYIMLDFEGKQFQCIQKYDEFLRIFYGDYMQLPPVEKRIGKHGIKAYYK